jgi:hypothetical protein
MLHFNLPLNYSLALVSFLGAALSAWFERGRPRVETIALTLIFLLAGVLQLASAHQSDSYFQLLKKSVDDTDTLVTSESPIIVSERNEIAGLRTSLTNLARFVATFGPRAAPPSGVVPVLTSTANAMVGVTYFPKKVDPTGITAALITAGFTHIHIGEPNVSAYPSNAIFYGGRVEDAAIRSAALAMLRAGVDLRGVRPYVSNMCSEPRAHSLEIGYSEAAAQHLKLTPTAIESQAFVRCPTVASVNGLPTYRPAKLKVSRVVKCYPRARSSIRIAISSAYRLASSSDRPSA